jgi:hypothetical protein
MMVNLFTMTTMGSQTQDAMPYAEQKARKKSKKTNQGKPKPLLQNRRWPKRQGFPGSASAIT